MRHRVAGRHQNRSVAHRTALFRNLMTELFRHERIKTGLALFWLAMTACPNSPSAIWASVLVVLLLCAI